MESVESVGLIKITFKRGKGTEDDPVRVVTQYWEKRSGQKSSRLQKS